MNGPCLCGDVYCPWCGDPAAAQWDEFVEEALARFELELELYNEVGIERATNGDEVAQALESFLQKNIEWLADRYTKSREEPSC